MAKNILLVRPACGHKDCVCSVYCRYSRLSPGLKEQRDKEAKGTFSRLFDFCIFLIPVGLLLAAANYLRFGNPLETGYGSEASSFSWFFFQRDWFDYLFSTQRGIIPFNPILLFALPRLVSRSPGSTATSPELCYWPSGHMVSSHVLLEKLSKVGGAGETACFVPILPILIIPFAFVPIRVTLPQKLILLFLTLIFLRDSTCRGLYENSRVLRTSEPDHQYYRP